MPPAERNSAPCPVTVHSRIIPAVGQMEIAFLALAVFAAFMAAQSLTAYVNDKYGVAKRGNAND